MAEEVSMVHVTKDGLKGDQGNNSSAHSSMCLLSPLE
jgi:hypothetical protein